MPSMKEKKIAVVNEALCAACGACEEVCPRHAIRVVQGVTARVNAERCVGCGRCARTCPADNISMEIRA